MKLRHAAAFAVWFLMVPQQHQKPDGSIDTALAAPLAHWVRRGSFDSAGACAQKQFDEQKAAIELPDGPARDGALALFTASRCIASDDPQLAK